MILRLLRRRRRVLDGLVLFGDGRLIRGASGSLYDGQGYMG
ncbi:hypothetical protein [Streptomyces sp. NPDC096132]